MIKSLISIIIPAYNEEKDIVECLQSLQNQSYKLTEIIIVDDGSKDKTIELVKEVLQVKLLKQNHKGPGLARNLGAKDAKGEILVFVDADMTFDKDFIERLTLPIRMGKAIGTFSKDEMLKNVNNVWAVCWNINRQVPKDELYTLSDKLTGFFWNIFSKAEPERMHHPKSSETSPVFRAILKSEFEKVGGFAPTGEYTDDWSLSRKLGVKASNVKGAIFYHSNPGSLAEVWKQTRWVGKSEFISGSFFRKIKSAIKFSFPASIIIGFIKSVINLKPQFIIFKVWYDSAVFTSVTLSFFGEQKSK